MKIHHSTHWNTLSSLLGGNLLSPSDFGANDRKNVILKFLSKHEIGCSWFTTQVWTTNKFGPYTLIYNLSEIALDPVLDIGKHNGARCFLSAPPLLISWLQENLAVDTKSLSDPALQQTSRSDRIDFLICWKIPLGHDLYVTQADTNRGQEDDANFACARLLAHLLLTGNERFKSSSAWDRQLKNVAANLLSFLVGRYKKFEGSPTPQSREAADELIKSALQELTLARFDAARNLCTQIGGKADVAAALLPHFNKYFASSLKYNDLT